MTTDLTFIRKAILQTAILLTALLFMPLLVMGQALEHPGRDHSETRKSPNGSVSQTIGTRVVSIEYSRPYVKGRQVFGGLQKYGEVWRAGANEATTILIPNDVSVEGEPLAAGVYSFFTIPGQEEWTLIFNSRAKIWGTRHDPANDVLRVVVDSREAPHSEMLTYAFEAATNNSVAVVLTWGTTAVPFNLTFGE